MEVGGLLEDCLRAAAAPPSVPPSEGVKLSYCRCRDSLCAELASLLQDAMDMKWPFAPEKWQYKQSVDADDKTNLNDLISKHLPQLLALLKASIVAQEAQSALAVVFLVDRFFYWTDESSRLLKIAKLLHQHHRHTPIAPQLIIRQARVYLNSGKLQKAEYILSSLINNSGTAGSWVYHSESDRTLVQAVSVQVRGMILQKLGLWLEAAELIWASLVGYYSLPQPDKKGIGTSLGILANILVSMNDEDFHAFRTNSNIDFSSLLGEGSHRLLSAAQAAKMAVVYSQYTSLYVLTNVTTQGTCLLSYSFSLECPSCQRESFLLQAREAFAIGLLTKAEGDLVTSQQELHTFLKAAYSIAIVQKWLGTPREVVAEAAQTCQKGLAKFYEYCHASIQNKDSLSTEVMHLVTQVKVLLGVDPMPNSDKGSFIPDSYRNVKDSSVHFTLEGFSKIMQRFQKYHATLCKTNTRSCKGMEDETEMAKLCFTAVGTTIGTLDKEGAEPEPTQKSELCKSRDLGSSWQKISMSSSPRPSSSGYLGSDPTGRAADASDQSCVITEGYDDMSGNMFQPPDKNKKQNPQGCKTGFSSHAVSKSATPVAPSKLHNDLEAGKETLDTDLDWIDDVVVAQNQSGVKDVLQSLSQLTLKTSSSSLGDSFGSQSSWEKISAEQNSPMDIKPHPSYLPKAGTMQGCRSPDSDGSFFIMETLDLETDDSAHHVTYKNHKSAWEVKALLKQQALQNRDVYPDTESETDEVPEKPAVTNDLLGPHNHSQAAPNQYEATETSTKSSFELLEVEVNQNRHQPNTVSSTENKKVPQRNLLCSFCLNSCKIAAQQFLLSQQDYQALLAGVCHDCLLARLYSEKTQFQLSEHQTAYSALHLKFSKATGLWTGRETCAYIGELLGLEGKQRAAIWVQFLHQEERLSSYVGKDYLKPTGIQFHLKDVERQMTAQYYVTQFNKRLYDKDDMAQIFFIPSEALLILKGDEIVGCVTVEPYMLGDFVKLTNNTRVKDMRFKATNYGLAFGHFTYQFSGGEEVVVDLQGWVTANGKGLTYLTDPQIHSTRTPKARGNFADRGLRLFLEEQHGPECNEICRLLKLRPLSTRPCVLP